MHNAAQTSSATRRQMLAIACTSAGALALSACATPYTPKANTMSTIANTPKEQVVALLSSLETGDAKAASVLNPNKYIQHNLDLADGVAGVAALLQKLPKGSTKVRVVRVFQDGDYVFAHVEYDFFGPKIGFDVFRFENGQIVEHWDNLQTTPTALSPSGHSMIDGPTVATDLGQTAANKALMQRYMDDLLAGRRETFASYFNGNSYIQHNPWVADNLTGLVAGLQSLAQQGKAVKYTRVFKVLAEGNFVLVMAEGTFGGQPTGYYDLYRIQDGKIAEHWDTLQAIPPKAEQQNPNGKF